MITFFLLFLYLAQGQEIFAAPMSMTPEQEAAYLGKKLRPISDQNWRSIAGPRVADTYDVIKGDTLSDISKKLFGNQKYWPKIWALNNETVSNPHWLKPGFHIAFSPGSASSLPSFSVEATDAPAPTALVSKKRSTQWKLLPKQSWEHFDVELPKDNNLLGFDENTKIFNRNSKGFEPIAIPADQEMPFLGQIIGSRTESQFLSLNDLVYISAEEKIQIGDTYGLTRLPTTLKSSKSDRIGYSYLLLGKVKILGLRDRLYVGRILSVREFVPRGTFLISMPSRIQDTDPIPGPRPVPGVLFIDHNFSTYATAQHKEVFIDRGTDDGVQVGMVFRAYQHKDPSNSKKFSNSNFIIDANFMVTQVTPTFCSAIVLNNLSPVVEYSPVILLTDVSDLFKNDGFANKGIDDEDDLDDLDDGKGMTRSERKELKQMEKWRKNPDTPPPPVEAPMPETAPTPEPFAEPSPSTSPSPTALPPEPKKSDSFFQDSGSKGPSDPFSSGSGGSGNSGAASGGTSGTPAASSGSSSDMVDPFSNMNSEFESGPSSSGSSGGTSGGSSLGGSGTSSETPISPSVEDPILPPME